MLAKTLRVGNCGADSALQVARPRTAAEAKGTCMTGQGTKEPVNFLGPWLATSSHQIAICPTESFIFLLNFPPPMIASER